MFWGIVKIISYVNIMSSRSVKHFYRGVSDVDVLVEQSESQGVRVRVGEGRCF